MDFSVWKKQPKLLMGILALCILLTFSIDISTKAGVGVGVLYVLVVLLGSIFPHQYVPILTAGITSILVIIGGFLSPRGYEIWVVMTNRLLSLLVIWGIVLVIYQYRGQKSIKRHKAFLEKKIRQRTQDLLTQRDQLRKLASDLTLVEHRERRRLATELHDYLAQLLVVGHMKTQQALASPQKQLLSSELAEVDALLDRSLTYTRTLVAELSPTILFDLGLAPALNWLAGQMSQHGLIVHVKVDSDLSTITEDQAILIYQSVRELLFNVVKHAETDTAEVSLKQKEDGSLEVTVRDYGKGCEMRVPDSHHQTFGLFNIQERVEAMEGRMSIESRPREGMKVVVTVPLQSPQVSHRNYQQASPSYGLPVSTKQLPESAIPGVL